MFMLALKVVRGVVAEMVLVVEVVVVVVVQEEVEVRRWIWHLCHSSIGSKPMTYQL